MKNGFTHLNPPGIALSISNINLFLRSGNGRVSDSRGLSCALKRRIRTFRPSKLLSRLSFLAPLTLSYTDTFSKHQDRVTHPTEVEQTAPPAHQAITGRPLCRRWPAGAAELTWLPPRPWQKPAPTRSPPFLPIVSRHCCVSTFRI